MERVARNFNTLPALRRVSFALRAGIVAAALGVTAAASLASIPDGKASRLYEDALQRFERKDVSGAVIQLKNALQIDRSLLPIHVLLGKALMANGEAAAAEVALTEALRLGVNRAEVALPLAQSYIAQGKQKEMLESPHLAPAGLPAGVQFQLLLQRALAAGDLGDLKAAMKNIEEARSVDPRSPDSWIAEVPLRIRTRELKEALAAADKAMASSGGSAAAWYHKAMVEHVTGNVRAAMAGYDKAITLDADHMEARLARAGLYLDLDRPAEAAAEVEELRKRFPKEPRGAYLAALLAERKGDAQAAQARLREVTALLDAVPMDYIRYRPQVLMLNGLAHFGLSELEKAKPYFEALLPRAQTPLPALKPLAQIHLAERNPARAAELLEWYMRAHPSDLQAMVLLASAYVAKGQNTKAFDLLQEAMRNNDTPQMRSVLGMSLLGNGRWQDALPELEVAFKRDPRGQTYAGSMLAMLYLKNGQLPKAEAVAQALAKQDPSNPVFHNLLGMVLARTGNAAGARKAFEQALKIDDRLSAPKLNLARLDMNERAFDAAERRLTPLLKADDRNVDARLEAARLAALRGKDEDEQALLEKANELSTARDPRAGLALIALHLRRGKPAAAVDVAKRLASRRGEDVTVLLAYANAQNINGDTTGARSTLSKATTLAGYSAPRQIEIASLQLAAGNLPGARYSADKALSAVPDFLPAQALLVDLDLRQGDTAKAEQLARKITASHPQRAIGYSLLGDVAAARGQGAAALEGYRKAHQLEPNTESFLRLFKATSLQEGNEAGQRLAEAWVKTHPKDIRARKALADALARSGNLPAARSAYEALLKVSPDDAEAMNNLANLLLRAKDRAALEVAERALSLAPQNTNVIDTVGWAALQAGQPDRALQLLRDARLRDPANNEVRYHLAAVLAKAGRRNEAREELQAALRSGRPFDSVAEARSLMSTLD